jgi:hypothetical protein
MPKITPNPPENDDVSPYESTDPKKLNEAADRALDYYLKPVIPNDTPRNPAPSTPSPPTPMTKHYWSTPAKPWRRRV